MKLLVAMVAMVCATVALPAWGAEGSIASKVEELGRMDSIKVTDIIAARRDNLLRVQVTFTNLSPKNEQLYYRCRWLDSDGFTVWDEESWKPELIYGKQNKVVHIVAPTFKATDFKLELQSPRNSAAPGHSSTAD